MTSTFTLKSISYDGRYMQLDCTQVKDIATNTSTINWTLTVTGGSVNLYSTGPTTVKINGEQVYYKEWISWSSYAFPAAKGSVSGTLKVEHNSDGSKSIPVSISTAIYNPKVQTTSGNWQLDQIPRSAIITSAPDITDEDTAIVVGYSNPVGSRASSVEIAITSADGNSVLVNYRTLNATGNSYTITNITDTERAALCAYVTKGHTATIAYKTKTVIDSNTYYGTLVKKTLTLVNYLPLISISAQDVHAYAQHYLDDGSTFLKGKNEIQYAITATGAKGATIASYSAVCGGETKTTATGTFIDVRDPELTFTVTDSRGNTATKKSSLEMIDYTPVTCSQEVSIELSGETTAVVNIEATGNFVPVQFPTATNELTLFYRTKVDGGEFGGWQYPQNVSRSANGNNYTAKFAVDGLDYTKTHTIQLRVYDFITEALSDPYTVNLIPVFDWSNTDFNFNVPVTIQGLSVPTLEGQGTSGGWNYRKWSDGTLECWRRAQINATVNSAWGSLYSSGALSSTNLTYPFEFVELPCLTVTLMPFGAGGILMAPGSSYGSTTTTGAFEIARGTQLTSSTQFLLSYYAIGKWK